MPPQEPTARWLPEAQRWYGTPENRFISGREAIRRLTPSLAGFHGYKGRLQPYEGVAAVLGEGRPTPKHRWWVTDTDIDEPRRGAEAGPGRQFLAEIEIAFQGEVVETRTVGAKVGAPWVAEQIENLETSAIEYANRWAQAQGVSVADVDYEFARFKQREFHPVGLR